MKRPAILIAVDNDSLRLNLKQRFLFQGFQVLEASDKSTTLQSCPARRRMAWITEPAPRNRQALKNAWVKTWKIAAPNAPAPAARNMYPSWRHGRVREHLLDVVLRQPDGRRKHRRQPARPPRRRAAPSATSAKRKFGRATM